MQPIPRLEVLQAASHTDNSAHRKSCACGIVAQSAPPTSGTACYCVTPPAQCERDTHHVHDAPAVQVGNPDCNLQRDLPASARRWPHTATLSTGIFCAWFLCMVFFVHVCCACFVQAKALLSRAQALAPMQALPPGPSRRLSPAVAFLMPRPSLPTPLPLEPSPPRTCWPRQRRAPCRRVAAAASRSPGRPPASTPSAACRGSLCRPPPGTAQWRGGRCARESAPPAGAAGVGNRGGELAGSRSGVWGCGGWAGLGRVCRGIANAQLVARS